MDEKCHLWTKSDRSASLWTKSAKLMEKKKPAKLLVDQCLQIMLCFCLSLFLFMVMNFIEYIMYELCADYETGILDYVFHI